MSYAHLQEAELAAYAPRVVFVDGGNRVVELGTDPAHAPEGSGLLSGAG
jgi:aspartate 1-decarboxylase